MGGRVDFSGNRVNFLGNRVDILGGRVDFSGNWVDFSGAPMSAWEFGKCSPLFPGLLSAWDIHHRQPSCMIQ